MLTRISNFSQWLDLPQEEIAICQKAARKAADLSNGMFHLNDYLALGACLFVFNPKKIFEIGTYLGVTANFILEVLPESTLVSIAYVNPPKLFGGKRFNNSELRKSHVGRHVEPTFKSRYHQLFGDSHQLKPEAMINRFGAFDLVFIDGDHSVEGVRQDTQLALSLLGPDGTICWHDANPKERYQEVRDYLENMPLKSMATSPNYVGGLACWNREIERRLERSLGES